ncbi:MAG: alpha-amylase family glycosyl hydrolase, partial [Candidatus Sulfotelmatobacter sp.]
MKRRHSMPFGAEARNDGRVRFRLWAPAAQQVEISLEDSKRIALERREQGWFELVTAEAKPGSLYRFRINGEAEVPDPASRFQPHDVHGPSEVIDPQRFDWKDDAWRGRSWHEAIIYELHVGVFARPGTFSAVQKRLDYLADLGVTAIELMPVSDFPGQRNWGYDGVFLFAPDSTYGRPEDLKNLVQAAHQRGMMILLDVVYNHFGPQGNYLGAYAPQFFTDRHKTPWGKGINFDGAESRVVRDFFIQNALYWLTEYHFDGLRLDAVHAILDDSTPDILTELANVVRSEVEPDRQVHLILENERNQANYLRRTE